MDSLESLRIAIQAAFADWEKLPRIPSDWKISAVSDTTRDRYTLQMVDLKNDRFSSRTLAHLEIQQGKIWILTDNTEEGIATDLIRYGVPKSQIVLGFYPPALREMGEFAVA